MKQAEKLAELIKESEALNSKAQKLQDFSLADLQVRPHEKAWNTLEIIKHVNYYIAIYNKQFEISLNKAKALKQNQELQSGYWGKKFIGMMEPNEKGIKKMKTFKSKDTLGLDLDKAVLQEFIGLNTATIKMLERAQAKDVQQVKCKLAIPLLKLNLGDAFQFIIAHNLRHFQQIEKTLPATIPA